MEENKLVDLGTSEGKDLHGTPIPFEEQHPETAAFIQNVYKSGGRFVKTPKGYKVFGIDKYSPCICGSGKKLKFCCPQVINTVLK